MSIVSSWSKSQGCSLTDAVQHDPTLYTVTMIQPHPHQGRSAD
jgi:hypothetical protein